MSVTRIDKAVSLGHEIARTALRKSEGFDRRWLQSETKVQARDRGKFAVRIRAYLFEGGNSGGSWVTICTTVEQRDKYTYFPGDEVSIDTVLNIPKKTYQIRSWENGYGNLSHFEIV